MNGQVVRGLSGPQRRVHRVGAGAEHHVWPEQHIVPHINIGVIHQGQAEIGIDIVAEMHVFAGPVGVQRRLDVAAGADLGKTSGAEAAGAFSCSAGRVAL